MKKDLMSLNKTKNAFTYMCRVLMCLKNISKIEINLQHILEA